MHEPLDSLREAAYCSSAIRVACHGNLDHVAWMANEELDILSKAKALVTQVFIELKIAQNILVRHESQPGFAKTLERVGHNLTL